MWPWTGSRAGSRSTSKVGSRAAAGGFTLIEVLAAFVILALALAVLLPGFATGMRSLVTADDYATATLLAQSRLELVGRAEPVEAGTTAGVLDDRFRWQLEIVPLPQEDLENSLPLQAYSVVLTVVWEAGSDERSITLETLRLGPPIQPLIQPPALPGDG
jgi:general secretion pathway protein I